MKTGLIYLLTFPNKKIYVGQTRTPLTVRLRRHKGAVRQGQRQPLYLAWRKHGAPTETVLEADISVENLDDRERHFIKVLSSTKRSVGYNASPGGDVVSDRTGIPSESRGARYEAKSKGETIYFTGKPCKYGHVAPRYTSSFKCCECARAESQTDATRGYKTKWRCNNKAKELELNRKRYAEQAEMRRARAAKFREANRQRLREYHGSYQRAWRARRKQSGVATSGQLAMEI